MHLTDVTVATDTECKYCVFFNYFFFFLTCKLGSHMWPLTALLGQPDKFETIFTNIARFVFLHSPISCKTNNKDEILKKIKK